nr:EH signature domain-containing protein [Ramlibacter paludis]
MLRPPALESLRQGLAVILGSFDIGAVRFGRPEYVEEAVNESAELFKEFSAARPAREASYAAALALMRGAKLDDEDRHLVAGALNVRVREQGGRKPIGHARFIELLEEYSVDAAKGELWSLTWFGLLCSHFEFDPAAATAEELRGWSALRGLLQDTWPQISDEAGREVFPDWVKVLREFPELLTERAGDKLGADYLQGDETVVRRIASDLAVPETSWFWHAVVLGAVGSSTKLSDTRFKESLSRLLALVKSRPVYRDEALIEILSRYQRCAQPTLHSELRDYVVSKDVWRNPKLRAAGLATTWNRVSDSVWRMVLKWVNDANLRDFFEVLAARGNADEGRLAFWSQYLDQIEWTRLVFSAHTRQLAASNAGIKNLIAREEGSFATLSTNADVDAFMMQLGNYVVVEFSRVPNAAYVYKADELPFEPNARTYSGTTSDLKRGYHEECAARILHRAPWEDDAAYQLRRLGIHPDEKKREARRVPKTPVHEVTKTAEAGRSAPPAIQTTEAGSKAGNSLGTIGAPRGAKFTMDALRTIVGQYPGAQITDRRSEGGRLWIQDPQLRFKLDAHLKGLGFKWANTRDAWYYPEN